jgi:hypothetical protein
MYERTFFILLILVCLYSVVTGFVSGKVQKGKFWNPENVVYKKENPTHYWLIMFINIFALLFFIYVLMRANF